MRVLNAAGEVEYTDGPEREYIFCEGCGCYTTVYLRLEKTLCQSCVTGKPWDTKRPYRALEKGNLDIR